MIAPKYFMEILALSLIASDFTPSLGLYVSNVYIWYDDNGKLEAVYIISSSALVKNTQFAELSLETWM